MNKLTDNITVYLPAFLQIQQANTKEKLSATQAAYIIIL